LTRCPLFYIIFIMKEKALIIKKASALIQTNVKNFTLVQRKLINLFIYIAQKNGDKEGYSISTSVLKKKCGITMKGNEDLKTQLLNLLGVVIQFNYLGKDNEDWEACTLISGARIQKGSKYTEFEFPKRLREKILTPNMYVPLNILLIANLKSKYTIVLYEFLKDYLHSPAIPELTILQFKNLMGVEEGRYKKFKDFRKRVIDKAVNEINESTEIQCFCTLVKNHGNKYSHIKFVVKENKNFKFPQSVSLVEDTEQLPLFKSKTEIPTEILKILPQKYQINLIYHQIAPYFDDLDFLISNIKYANQNCTKNYPAYLKLALKNDYAKVNREVKEKKDKIVQNKKDHIKEKKDQEKLLKQKVWDYFNSLLEGEQVEFRSDAEEKMSAVLKFIKIPEVRKDIINAQIEKDMFAELEQVRKI